MTPRRLPSKQHETVLEIKLSTTDDLARVADDPGPVLHIHCEGQLEDPINLTTLSASVTAAHLKNAEQAALGADWQAAQRQAGNAEAEIYRFRVAEASLNKFLAAVPSMP